MTNQVVQFVDETTGEVIDVQPSEFIPAESMMTYAIAKTAGDSARLQLAERVAELRREDQLCVELEGKVSEAERVTRATEIMIESLFTAEERRRAGVGISLDFGFSRITWPKPSSLWKQGVKPEQIQREDPELAARLKISQAQGAPQAPRITIRAEKLAGVTR